MSRTQAAGAREAKPMELNARVVEALPNGTHRSLAGAWHGVPDDVLAPVLTGFLRD